MRVVRSAGELDGCARGGAARGRGGIRRRHGLLRALHRVGAAHRGAAPARTATGRCCASASGSARSSAGTRRCSRSRRRPWSIRRSGASSARRRSGSRDAIDYRGAGTAEFVVTGREFFFLELNARIQVEHPVTEAVTGLDLVADADPDRRGPRARGGRARRAGHAIEVRLYAEDPRTLPAAERSHRAAPAAGLGARRRGVDEGDTVGTRYDPMIAKLIAHGATREEAIAKLRAALAETEVGGVTTNLPFLRWLVAHPAFRAGDTTTDFLTRYPPLSLAPPALPEPSWRGVVPAQPPGRPRLRLRRISTIPRMPTGAARSTTRSWRRCRGR